MLHVAVVSSTGTPLMPCHPARARELVREGRALRRFDRGLFYLRMLDRADGETQPIAVGVDPGSKREGLTAASAHHTYVNVLADAVTWVKQAVETRRMMRHNRRFSKTPCRPQRNNRSRGSLQPSTKARWQWKLRLCRWLARRYPISVFVVEDVKVKSQPGKTGEARFRNVHFAPILAGKNWFYTELTTLASLTTLSGPDVSALRQQLGLAKTTNKMAEAFTAHNSDAWTLAHSAVGGAEAPDCTRLLRVTPLQFHRRQLHMMQPVPGGIRRAYGSTRSLGFKRGALVKHANHGIAYVGGTSHCRISLHSIQTGRRLTRKARPEECQTLAPYNGWRARLLPDLKTEGGH